MAHHKQGTTVSWLALIGGLATAATVSAQEVTLISGDGAVDMTGELVEFADNTYVIATALGDLRLSAARVACEGDACPRLIGDVSLGGSAVIGTALLPALLDGYAATLNARPEILKTGRDDHGFVSLLADQGNGGELVSFAVTSGTSADGIAALVAGDLALAMATRQILPAEVLALTVPDADATPDPVQEHIIAVDRLVVVTNPGNDIAALTAEQLRQLYTGQIDNWAVVGGSDIPVTLVTRPAGSDTRAIFEAGVFADRNLVASADAILATTDAEAAQIVSATPGAIAYLSHAYQADAKPVALIADCGIVFEPTALSARTGEYPLQRRIYLYSRADRLTPAGQAFVDYVTSPAAEDVLAKAGFIGFAVERHEQSLEGRRARALLDADVTNYQAGFMRRMLGQMADFDRLSTTFRFQTGSARLDARGQVNMARLIDYLAGQPDGTEVLMVGFTDDVGGFDSNLTLSAQRAARVATQVRAAAAGRLENVTISTTGYGEIAPTGCNDNAEGRQINRRVEVWIKSPR